MFAQLAAFRTEQRFVEPEIVPAPQAGLRGVGIAASAVLAILVDGSATATINAGLPYLQGVTAATPDEGSWIISAFNATYYAFILASPWLMARFGRKPLLVAALLGFSALSVLLAATTDYATFVVLRALQGACLGSVFVPAVVLLFTSLTPQTLAFAPPAFVFVALSGSTLGTVVGGWAADELGASMVFVPGAIATALTAALIYFVVNTSQRRQRLPFDWVGVALSIVSFGSLQYLANDGERRNWFDDSGIVTGAVVCVLAATTFVFYELYLARNPHVDFRMFAKYRNLLVGAIVNMLIGAAGYSVTLFVAYLESALGATPTLAGAAVLVRLPTYFVGVFTAFFLIRYKVLDFRAVVVVGSLGSACGLFAFANAMTTTADVVTFVGLSLVFGFFYSMMSQPIGTLVIGSMPLPMLAAGISIYKLTSPIGLMAATGAIATVLDHRFAAIRTTLAASIAPSRAPIAQYVAGRGAAGLSALVSAQALTLSYAFAMLVCAAILVPVGAIAFFARGPKPA